MMVQQVRLGAPLPGDRSWSARSPRSKLTPLLHITLPEDDGDENFSAGDRHVAPIVLALEAMIAVNLWHIRRALRRAEKGLGAPIPPLYLSGVYYKEDEPGHEDWRDVYTVLERGCGDCLPLSTLVLRDDYQTVAFAHLRPGDRILGDGAWTTVQEAVVTGEKEILALGLSNGCTLRCSSEHRVFRDVDGRVEEIRASEVRIGDDLVQGSSVPRVAQDIAINDRLIADFFAKCGHTAPEKHLASLRFASDESVRVVIEGLAADAGRAETGNSESSLVYSTTSRQLALQLRILHRMLGISVSIRRVDDHGGLGENPIYRVIPRVKTREGYAERRDKKFARVRSIAAAGVELCGDITTDSGRFWLPESDVLVHNCDNLVAWRTSELIAAGAPAEPVVKYQMIPRDVVIKLGILPAHMVPAEGVLMVHCAVRTARPTKFSQWTEDGWIEDPSKLLGMGANFSNRV